MYIDLKKSVALPFFLALFSYYTHAEVTDAQREIVQDLPPDQREKMLEKLQKANQLQSEIDEIFEEESSLIKKPELNELSEDDKLVVARARKIERFLSQPFFVAEVFTNAPGKYVPLSETIRGFKGIVNGDYDDIPEQAVYMTGNIDEVVEKAKTEAA